MWAKQVWLKDGKLQTYTNKWEDVNVWPTPTPVPVTGVSLDQNSATIVPEGTLQLTATITPSDATNKKVTWSSSNNTIAHVSSAWLVTAGSLEWETTITVKTKDGNYTDTCAVTVSNHVPEVQSVDLASLSEENTGYANRTMSSVFTVSPYTASNPNVSIVSSDSSVVEVWEIYYNPYPSEWNSWDVQFYFNGTGTATVTITSLDNPEATATYNFEVLEDVPVTSISNVSSSSASVYSGISNNLVTFEYSPTDAIAPSEDISFSLKEGEDDIGYGYINGNGWDGQVTFNANGNQWDSAVYELYALNDSSNKEEITVTIAGEWVAYIEDLDQTGITITEWATDSTKTFTYAPISADIDSIDVTIDDTGVATAQLVKDSDWNAHVEVTGVSEWQAYISLWVTWIIQYGWFYVDVEAVPVVYIESISNLSSTSVSVLETQTATITADYLPLDAVDYSNVTFVPTVDNIATAYVSSINSGTMTIQIDGDSAGTTQFEIYIDWTATGLTIDVTVNSAYTITFTPRDTTYNQEWGWTISQSSIVVPTSWASIILWTSDSADAIVSVTGQPDVNIIPTEDSWYTMQGWYYWDESDQQWKTWYMTTLQITGDLNARYYFGLNQ